MTKNTILSNVLITLLVISGISGCVTSKKYDDLLARKLNYEDQLQTCSSELAFSKTSNEEFLNEIKKLKRDKKDLKTSNIVLKKTQALYKELEKMYEKLLKNHSALTTHAAQSTSKTDDLSKLLTEREKELQESKLKNIELSYDLKIREQNVKHLEKLIADKDKEVKKLKDKVTNALYGFKDNDLSIEIKNGKVYVTMAQNLLFKSGSYQLDKKGIEALKKLASVLKTQYDINILVEGHTDDVQITSGISCMKDNWDLSVFRATSIVRILASEGINSKRLLAAGRGEHMPIATGTSTEDRRKNRRTEIILSPKLDKLFEMLETN